MSEGKTALTEFVRESNRIEGIVREPTHVEIAAHERFLALDRVTVRGLQNFVEDVARAQLRNQPGMNVRVGSHLPPPGGPDVEAKLKLLLKVAQEYPAAAHAIHKDYELLHPFMDGNGRSGRVLWAWMMQRDEQDPFALPFLHRFYYQTLSASR